MLPCGSHGGSTQGRIQQPLSEALQQLRRDWQQDLQSRLRDLQVSQSQDLKVQLEEHRVRLLREFQEPGSATILPAKPAPALAKALAFCGEKSEEPGVDKNVDIQKAQKSHSSTPMPSRADDDAAPRSRGPAFGFKVITGIFVDNASQYAQQDKDTYVVNHVVSLFEKSDLDEDGAITWETFSSMMRSQELKEFFAAVDVDMDDASGLFNLIDFNDNGSITRQEFMQGWIRLRGSATALDLHLLMRDYRVNEALAQRQFKEMATSVNWLCQSQSLVLQVLGLSSKIGSAPEVRITQESEIAKVARQTESRPDSRLNSKDGNITGRRSGHDARDISHPSPGNYRYESLSMQDSD
eukprot:TRINITY_DN23587_c0_g1_i1.p1 TRINITY_DN23587_c0_g1~~TRINITY_DN23587_c0_g1_i1.p1  ORF type:complete len:353 (-),score=74.26 TRINITY_DN23587_c0_g1_i1:215-1273(-)